MWTWLFGENTYSKPRCVECKREISDCNSDCEYCEDCWMALMELLEQGD